MTTRDRIADIAQETGATIALAESLTSGSVAAELGKGSGASEWFAGCVVAYRTVVKENVLGMEPGTDPCSPECAVQIASGARRLLGSDVAVSVTGVGGPDPEDGHDAGTVWLGWSTATASGAQLLQIDGDPPEVVGRASEATLSLLLGVLERSRDGALSDNDGPFPLDP